MAVPLLAVLAAQATAQNAGPLPALAVEHCVECHSGERPKGELDLEGLLVGLAREEADVPREVLERVRRVLVEGEMPPPRRTRPPEELVADARDWLDAVLGPAPERPTVRRLNRVEYERAVRDLVGIVYPARELFPADDVGALFDNDAVSAAASELHVERWVDAAERIADQALPREDGCQTVVRAAAELESDGGAHLQGQNVSIYSSGRALATFDVPRASRYRLEVTGWGDLAGDERPRVALECDGKAFARREFAVERPKTETLAATLALEPGPRELGARFLNDYYKPDAPDPGERDRNVHVARLALVGPLDPPPETAFTRWIDAALARGGVEDVVGELGLRIWRRPLAPEERARLAALEPDDAPPRTRLRTALAALLASPHFLYKAERSDASAPERAFELATRLAFFLWASTPDEELLASAATGKLERPEELDAQVRRLLDDARARALVEEFGAQWLGWRALSRATPDRKRFPEADAELLSSMRQESEAFFEAMLREDRALEEFLVPRFAFVDERLAALYGIEGVTGAGVRRVPVSDGLRGGLLGQAALLTATSNPTRTAPVKRGKWVLETLLGQRVPPPPPGVGVLAEPADGQEPLGLRARLERHRADPDCAACHDRLDPLGFALEGFDAIGRTRTHDGDAPVEAVGTLPDGTELAGVAALQRWLVASGRFPEALARALFVYALGREPDLDEARSLRDAVDALGPRRTLAGVIGCVCRTPAFLGVAPR